MENNKERTENTHIRSLYELQGQRLQLVQNREESSLTMDSMIHKSLIHFYFCVEGKAVFAFGPHYSREIQGHRNYFFYNPEKDLPFTLMVSPQTRMVVLTIPLDDLHQLFVHEPIPFLKKENLTQKFYDEREIPANLLVELNQLFSVQLDASASRLFYQGKILELLALYFSEKKPDTENCPFLNDQATVRRIKQAKEQLLTQQENPPTIKELSRSCGLNEYQLKAGFKEIYGNTIYGYLLDHKLDSARVLLDSGQLQVSEVAYRTGYSNPSHFISAFRKKFGVTPKKYLLSRRAQNAR